MNLERVGLTDEDVVRSFFATVLSGDRDVDALDRFLDPAFVDHDPAGDDSGVAGVRSKLEGMWSALPDAAYDLQQLVAGGGFVAARSQLVSGDQRVDFADFYRLDGGLITEHWHVVDAAALQALFT